MTCLEVIVYRWIGAQVSKTVLAVLSLIPGDWELV